MCFPEIPINQVKALMWCELLAIHFPKFHNGVEWDLRPGHFRKQTSMEFSSNLKIDNGTLVEAVILVETSFLSGMQKNHKPIKVIA